jgi:hypothetical protein
MTHNQRISSLMQRYFEHLDAGNDLLAKAAKIKEEILTITDPGKYENGTVFKVKKTLIEVKAYTRRGYKGIRRR